MGEQLSRFGQVPPAWNAASDHYNAAVAQLGKAIRRGAPAVELERLRQAASQAGADGVAGVCDVDDGELK